jgi:hypothetical protein
MLAHAAPGQRARTGAADAGTQLVPCFDFASLCEENVTGLNGSHPGRYIFLNITDAEQTDDPVVKNEMLELASVCEEVANNIEDHLTGG